MQLLIEQEEDAIQEKQQVVKYSHRQNKKRTLSKRNTRNNRQYNTTIGKTREGYYPRETRETTGSIIQLQVEQEEDAIQEKQEKQQLV